MFDIFGPAFPPPVGIELKFCTPKRTQMPVGAAKFDLNRCNESLLLGEKPDFWPLSKFNTGSLPLRGNSAGNNVIVQTTSQSTYLHNLVSSQSPRGTRSSSIATLSRPESRNARNLVLILRKIIKIVATRCRILRLKFTKFDFVHSTH